MFSKTCTAAKTNDDDDYWYYCSLYDNDSETPVHSDPDFSQNLMHVFLVPTAIMYTQKNLQKKYP